MSDLSFFPRCHSPLYPVYAVPNRRRSGCPPDISTAVRRPHQRLFGLDVILSAVVLLILIFSEGAEKKVKHLWLPVLVTLGVGVSAGLPLYLYMRERQGGQG